MIEMISRFYTQNLTGYIVTQGISSLTGENVDTLSTGASFKGRIRPLSARESYYQNKENLEITHYLYCAADSVNNTFDKVTYGSQTYDVNDYINPMEMNKYYRLELKAVI
jgi:hypothetical protein